MSFTSMSDLSTGDLVTEADMDAIRGNINYLLNPAHDSAIHDNAADYTTTSNSWVDVDATDLSFTLTTYGGPVMIAFSCMATNNGGTNHGGIDVAVDGTRLGAALGFGLVNLSNGDQQRSATVIHDLAAGAHTFKLQYRSDGSNTTTIYSNNTEPVIFSVIEI